MKCDKHLDNHLQESQNPKIKHKIDIARYILKIQIKLFVNLPNKYILDRNNLYIYNIDEPNN